MQKNYRIRAALFGTVMGALVLGSLTAAFGDDDKRAGWPFGGGDVSNSRNAASEETITRNNVSHLQKKWEFVTAGDVSATPTIETKHDQTTLYAVDWGGYLYSINADTGVPIWSRKISDYTGNTVKSVCRTSPAIVGDTIIIADQGDVGSSGFPQGGGTTASVMAINKGTGALIWREVVSDHPFSLISSSPVVYKGVIYLGVASLEESAGFIPGYTYSFRGKVVALNATTGTSVWASPFTTISDDAYANGYTGASVWSSTPVVDADRGLVYVTTGNNYSTPADGATSPASASPAPADDHIDSVLALDSGTGKLRWAFRTWNGDNWNVASWVYAGKPTWTFNSTGTLGPDWDFGSGANLFTTKDRSQLLGAGAKSGIYYALDPNTGSVVWSTQDPATQLSNIGPYGTAGGIEWGSAVDGKRVYCALANSDSHAYTLIKPSALSAPTTTAGLWSCLDAASGSLLWQTADPKGGHDFSMVTIANGVMFAASSSGDLYALDAATGAIKWNFTATPDPATGKPASSICGPSVVNGTVYWGSGYSHLNGALGSSGVPKLYAFSLK